jgi:uncharacterized membrane protein YeaQ/YmgE (transglycosylase-associated protein family)
MPGGQHLTFIMTALLGIGGSIIGGLIARLFSKPEPGSTSQSAISVVTLTGIAGAAINILAGNH